MKNKLCIAIILCTIGLILSGCGVKISDVELSMPKTLTQGESVQAQLLVQTENEVDEAKKQDALQKLGAVWASSDESVATVDQNGNVTAVNGGKVTISVTAGEFTKSFELTISVPLQGLTAEKELKLAINKTAAGNVNTKLIPENVTVTGTITYKSSDEKIATVDDKGNVTAVANGKAVITAALDGKSSETTVTVTTAATGINLETTKGILYVGGSFTINASLEPAEAGEGKFTYTCSDASIAAVDENGTITAKTVGTAEITVKTADGLTAKYTLTVNKKQANNSGNATGGTAVIGSGTGATAGGTVTAGSGTSVGGNASGSLTMTPENCLYIGANTVGHGFAGICPHCGATAGCNGFGYGHDRAGTCAGCGTVKVFINEIPASNGKPAHNHNNNGGTCAVCCQNYNTAAPGHGSAGVCSICGCVSSGTIVAVPDGQGIDGLEGDAW